MLFIAVRRVQHASTAAAYLDNQCSLPKCLRTTVLNVSSGRLPTSMSFETAMFRTCSQYASPAWIAGSHADAIPDFYLQVNVDSLHFLLRWQLATTREKISSKIRLRPRRREQSVASLFEHDAL